MPPPSPTRDERKEQLLAWKAQRQVARARASPVNIAAQQRRHVSAATPSTTISPERPATSSYRTQYIRRRRISEELPDAMLRSVNDDSGRQLALMNGPEMLDGRDQEDIKQTEAAERVNGLERVLSVQEQQFDAEEAAATMERRDDGQAKQLNGFNTTSAAETDDAMEETEVDATTVISTEKMQTVIYRADGNASAKMMNSKKRKAPCGRFTVVFAVVAGIVTASVAGGGVVCRMYPTSSAAVSIQFATKRAREYMYPVLNGIWDVVELQAASFGAEVSTKWLVILEDGILEKVAHALEALVKQDLVRWSELPRMENVSALNFSVEQIDHARAQLKPLVSAMVDARNQIIEWARSHLKDVFALTWLEPGAGDELLERLQSSLLMALAALVDSTKRVVDWMQLQVDEAFELIGFEAMENRMDLPSEQFLESLATNHAAMRNVREALVVQEARALQKVKRSEKRRVEIAEATHSIVADTRAVVLESVVEAKLAAIDYIEKRKKRLSDDFLASIEQELEEYVWTTRQLAEEGNPSILARVVAESQAQIDAALSLKRELTQNGKSGDGDSTHTLVQEEGIASKDVALDDVRTTDDQIPMIAEHTEDQPTVVPDLREKADAAHPEANQNHAAATEVLVGLEEMITHIEHTLADVTELSIVESSKQGQMNKQEENETAHEPVLAERKEDVKQPRELDTLPVENEQQPEEEQVEKLLPTGASSGPEVVDIKYAEEFSIQTDGLNLVRTKREETGSHNDDDKEKRDAPIGEDLQLQDLQNAEASYTEEVLVVDKMMVFDDSSIQVTEIANVLNDVKIEVESIDQAIESAFKSDGPQRWEATDHPSEAKTRAVPLPEAEALESGIQEAVRALTEANEMDQLLEDDTEEARAEEELRVIAEEEGIALHQEQESGDVSYEEPALEPWNIESIEETVRTPLPVDVDHEDGESEVIPGSPTVDSSSTAFVQAGMVSVVFLMLAGFAAYFFARRRKRGLFARAPYRRKRWQRFTDTIDSETEEVVLLSDAGSDEEEEKESVVPQKRDLEVIELMSSSDVDGMAEASSGGEDADEEEETSDECEYEVEKVEAVKEEIGEDEENDVETASTRSQTSVNEHIQPTSNSKDHIDTSNSDASPIDDSDSDAAYPADHTSNTASASLNMLSDVMADESTDIAQRTRLRLRKKSQEWK